MRLLISWRLPAAMLVGLPLAALPAGAFAQPAPSKPPHASNSSGTTSAAGADQTATQAKPPAKTGSAAPHDTTVMQHTTKPTE